MGQADARKRARPTHIVRLLEWSDNQQIVNFRYYIDPRTEAPHIHAHKVVETEVEEILSHPGEDRPGRDGSRVAIGKTSGGKYLRVIYIPDPEPASVFVVTAYDLTGKPLSAFRRRMKRRRQ